VAKDFVNVLYGELTGDIPSDVGSEVLDLLKSPTVMKIRR
jgi:hypothetical protein